jgi:lysozyme
MNEFNNHLTRLDFNPSNRLEKDFMPRRPLAEELFVRLAPAFPLVAYVPLVDLSHWNNVTSFKAIKDAGYVGVYLKATESDYYTDPTFSERWRKAADVGLLVGAFHFFRTNKYGGTQADHHLNVIRPLMDSKVYLPSAGDFETNDGYGMGERQARAKAFLDSVQAVQKKKPVIYTSNYLWSSIFGNPAWATNYLGWVAHWTSAPSPLLPVGWNTEMTILWQDGICGVHGWLPPSVPGVEGDCDHDKSYLSLTQLQELAGYVEPPSPGGELEARVARLEAEARVHGWNV